MPPQCTLISCISCIICTTTKNITRLWPSHSTISCALNVGRETWEMSYRYASIFSKRHVDAATSPT